MAKGDENASTITNLLHGLQIRVALRCRNHRLLWAQRLFKK